jgi:DNA-binding XRE family transcriptional regulator
MIYLISHSNQYLKIGYTKDIRKRLSRLQVSNPIKLEVLHLTDGDMELEKKLHDMFSEYNAQSGEWFYYNDKIINYFQDKKCLLWSEGLVPYDKINLIGEIKSERLKRNMSLQQLGELYGCSPQSMYEIETREVQGTITLKILYKMAKVFNKKFEYRFVDAK